MELEDNYYDNVYAISIGISEYEYFDTLSYAAKDAIAFSDALKSTYPTATIKTLLNKEASQGNIYQTMLPFLQKATSNDLLVFYFSGHGGAENNIAISNLLLTSTPANVYFIDALNLKELGDFLLFNPNKTRPQFLIIVDACRKGETDALEKTHNDIQTIFKQHSNLLLACEAGKESIEDGKLQQGVFTYFLLDAMKNCPEDDQRLTNYELELDELARYLSNSVREYTYNEQIPQTLGKMTEVIFPCTNEAVIAENAVVQFTPTSPNHIKELNNDPLHIFNQFNKVLKEGKEQEAKVLYEKMPDTEEAKNLKEVMREKLIEQFSSPSTSLLKTYIENGLDTLSLVVCNKVVEDLNYCISLVDSTYFQFNRLKGRVLFFEGLGKKIVGEYSYALNHIKESLNHEEASYTYALLGIVSSELEDWPLVNHSFKRIQVLTPDWYKFNYLENGFAKEKKFKENQLLKKISEESVFAKLTNIKLQLEESVSSIKTNKNLYETSDLEYLKISYEEVFSNFNLWLDNFDRDVSDKKRTRYINEDFDSYKQNLYSKIEIIEKLSTQFQFEVAYRSAKGYNPSASASSILEATILIKNLDKYNENFQALLGIHKNLNEDQFRILLIKPLRLSSWNDIFSSWQILNSKK